MRVKILNNKSYAINRGTNMSQIFVHDILLITRFVTSCLCSCTWRSALGVCCSVIRAFVTVDCHTCDTCPLCESEPETTAHFLLRCSKLSNIRQQYLPKIMSCYEQPSPDLLVRVILNSSYLSENRITHETLCRNYTYKLHHKRSILLGGRSGYKVNHL